MGRIGRKTKVKVFRKSLGVGLYIPAPTVFDSVKRTDDSPKRNAERDLIFYNRSACSSQF